MVNIFLTFDPIYQPFKPIKYSIVKECGGRPVGLNVYRGVEKEIVDLGFFNYQNPNKYP